ncbi:MAG: hypothetical protein R3E39_17610 [Anaerolineae bacterium]
MPGDSASPSAVAVGATPNHYRSASKDTVPAWVYPRQLTAQPLFIFGAFGRTSAHSPPRGRLWLQQHDTTRLTDLAGEIARSNRRMMLTVMATPWIGY